jgi:hypothetical protein
MPSRGSSSDPEAPEPRHRPPAEVEYGELPELTRALRAFGSARRTAGAFQSQFFMPLLEARRRAAEARSAASCVHAFDVVELTRAMDRALAVIVECWPDERPSVRRAVRAELQERAGPYGRALQVLAERARATLAADEATKLERWREWTVQLAATFEAADRSWLALRSVVESLPPKR